MDESFICPECGATISPADAWSDELRSTGQCPACIHARRTRRRILISLLAVAAIIVLPIGSCYIQEQRPWDNNMRFIRQPRPAIQAFLLTEAPLGTSRDTVKAVISNHRWRLLPQGRDANSIEAVFGHYSNFPFSTLVMGTWTFDGEGKLIKFTVEKATDGP